MQIGSALWIRFGWYARLQIAPAVALGAILGLGSLAGCASSPESMAEYRGFEYQYALAEKYRLGNGVPKDPAKAAYWYYQAATNPSFSSGRVGHTGARMRLAQAYRDGDGVEEDYSKAVEWYKLVVERNDSPSVKYEIAELYQTGGPGLPTDQAMAVQWYREAADGGMHWAQYRFGEAYREGKGVERDPEQAARLYEMAARQGNHWAQYRLSEAFRSGQGKPRDIALANEWLKQSADQGNNWAMLTMGDVYLAGDGVAADPAAAAKWYGLSLHNGNKEAQRRLDDMGWRIATESQ